MSIKYNKLIVKDIKMLKKDVYELALKGDDFSNVCYGQFINIEVEDKYLKRPISIMDISEDTLKITFKVLGEGTKHLSILSKGDSIKCIYPLGSGFVIPQENVKDILILAGGIGVPPLVGLYKYLMSMNKDYNIKVLLGFKNEDLEIYTEKFKNVEVCYDYKDGNIIKYIEKKDYFDKYKDFYTYSCGAMPMLNKISENFKDGQMLLEERMGCGFGACMGCSKKVAENKYKRVCVEGPMFYNSEVRYDVKN